MNSEDFKSKAGTHKAQAKKNLSQMFGIREGYSSDLVDSIIDDIIAATRLEIAARIGKLSEKD